MFDDAARGGPVVAPEVAVAEASALAVDADGAAPGQPHDDERPALLARVLRTDTSASLRRIAAWGLAEHGSVPVASAALVSALRGDASADVREMAAWALAHAGRDAAAGDALAAAVAREADARVRATAAWALGNVGLREAPRALVALLDDADAHVRRATAWALFSIADPATAPALQRALRTEGDPELQVAYVRALAAFGPQSVDVLRGVLDSPDPRVKTAAVRALAGGRAGGVWPWPRPRPFP